MPGTGKTTLANIMGNYFNIPVISSGALARAHGFAGSQAELEGRLDPDDYKIRSLVKHAIGNSTLFILDGYPRTVEQVESEESPTLDAVIYLKDTVYNVGRRLVYRGRHDDNLETITKRIETYAEFTAPLIDWYESRGKLITIKIVGTPIDIFTKIIKALNKKGVFEAVISIYELQKELANENRNRRTHKKVKKKR